MSSPIDIDDMFLNKVFDFQRVDLSNAAIYNGVMVYVRALSVLLRERSLNGDDLLQVANNGHLLLETIANIQNFTSM